jgi:glutaminyl-peptide cyclotransferase
LLGAAGPIERRVPPVRALSCVFAVAAALAPAGAGGQAASAPVYGYDVVSVWPHDRKSFTEGLAYHAGYLIESSAQASSLRKVALRSGRILRKVDLSSRYFAEGATVLRGRVYQLTWMEHRAFVYDLRTFRRLRTFRYAGEGWGLATDGRSLIMSDGSAQLTVRDPATFAVRRTITVTDDGSPITGLNELEIVRGRICANVYFTDRIACVDARSGQVRYWLDLTGLLPPELRPDEGAVLNGIAYDAKRNRLFVTGKLWPRLYQIRRRVAEG